MQNNGIVTLQPPSSGRAYVTEHVLEVSKANDVGDKITFEAKDSGFVITIPNADTLFVNTPKTLTFRVSAGGSKETEPIRDNVTVGEEYEYHVYCEDESDWDHKPGSSPPKIIIVD